MSPEQGIRFEGKHMTLLSNRAFPLCAILCLVVSSPVLAAERKRQIEEITVTAEKREATVSDTSISISAFSSDMIEDLGLQGADELINYLPATTRDAYDIRIRGVGRNFRALGGDPGVATYYNGVYSPDFGIAASENALYDLDRVEVLRGPQGTLYGRNSIGGALNYVTKKPTFDFEGELRAQMGQFRAKEYYGFLSGPIIDDVLAVRLVGVKRTRDGSQESISNSPDTDSVADTNKSLAILWQITDNLTLNARGNDRKSHRMIPGGVFFTEGSAANRDVRSTNQPVLGLHPVASTDPGAMAFTNPVTGATVYGAYNRPGVDPIGWPYQPNAAYGETNTLPTGVPLDDPNHVTNTNWQTHCRDFPYTNCDSNDEYFGHRSGQSSLVWDISDNTTLTYIYGNTDFKYTFNQDLDNAATDFSKYRQTVLEDVQNNSHELQLNWAIGDRFSATSGLYLFKERRDQDYSLTNTTPRYTQPADYGALDIPVGFLGGASVMDLLGAGEHKRLWSAAVGTSNFGRWDGDQRGDAYHHQNTVRNKATAVYTQGTFVINDRFDLVLGVRYAKDDKEALEVRGGYSELDLPWAMGFIGFIPGALGAFPDPATGVTNTAVINVAMGNATLTGNPADPIAPVCAITDVNCTHPLRLGYLPISWSSYVVGSDSWSDVNYRVNLDWTPNDDVLMYLSVTTGYRAGGFQLGVTDARDQQRDSMGLPIPGADIVPLEYDKETVRSIELGYKAMHLNNTLQVNGSIYQYVYDNYQDRLNVFDPVRNQGVDIVQNANGVINRGLEVEVLWLATDQLTIGGNYSYTDAFYDDDYFVVENDNPALPPSLFGSPATNPDLFVENAKGNQLKLIPKHKATVYGSYESQVSFGTVVYRASFAYTGSMYDSGITRPLDKVPSRGRLDLSVGWRDVDDRWTARLFVDNATDDKMVRGLGTAGESGNWALTGSILYPRFVGLNVSYRLGN
jgi:iron complex outermembrane receptor protein